MHDSLSLTFLADQDVVNMNFFVVNTLSGPSILSHSYLFLSAHLFIYLS
jgi:hypothetical protein